MICVSYTRTMSCSLLEEAPADIISAQNKRIAEYASKRKWKIEKKYSDRKSDRNEDTAFRSLREDGISQKYDCVIFDSMLRFGTTVYHAYDVLAIVFLPAGIHFAVVEDDFCSVDHTKDETFEYLKQKRHEYRIMHTKETTGRHLENRMYKKYGYRYVEGNMELEIDEEAAENIRTLFALICDGHTLQRASEIMNERGIEPPHLYMKRNGSNRKGNEKDGWLASQVRNIISNPLYTGRWVRTINCEKVLCSCPAIVSEEVYNRAVNVCLARQKGSRKGCKPSSNALSGIFFDYDSGCHIHQYRNQASGEKIFRLQYPKPANVNYPKMVISYDIVDSAVRDLLHMEQKKARLAIRMFDTPEFRTYKETRIEEIRIRAQAVFKRMMNMEFSSWQEQTEYPMVEQERNETELRALLSQIDEIEMMLSAKNPWVQLYANMKLSANLTSLELKKWITSATCEKFETVRIETKEKEAFLQLPQEWFREG